MNASSEVQTGQDHRSIVVKGKGEETARVGEGVTDVDLGLFHIFTPVLRFWLTLGKSVGLVPVGFGVGPVGFASGSHLRPRLVYREGHQGLAFGSEWYVRGGEVGPQGFAFGPDCWLDLTSYRGRAELHRTDRIVG